MSSMHKFGATLTALTGASIALAQAAPPPAPPTDNMEQVMKAYSRIPDTPGTGKFAATKTTDTAFPGHTVYRPRDLKALGAHKLPILLWGNGGCADDGASARLFLSEIASHGYLVVAAGTIKSGPGVPFRYEAPVAPPPGKVIPPVKTTYQDVAAGLDQAIAANADRTNSLYGKIDTSRVAVAGHSCGGLQALQLGGDPRIKTVLVLNSGLFSDGANPIAGMTVHKDLLKALHTPILYMLGGPEDVAYPNGTDDFARIDTVPAALVNLPTGHGGTFMQPNGGEGAKITVAWLNWQLRGDKKAASMFVGEDCGLCRTSGVKIERKHLTM